MRIRTTMAALAGAAVLALAGAGSAQAGEKVNDNGVDVEHTSVAVILIEDDSRDSRNEHDDNDNGKGHKSGKGDKGDKGDNSHESHKDHGFLFAALYDHTSIDIDNNNHDKDNH
jgi:hypothetical protein